MMPRPHRILVEGGLYHGYNVYNRFSSGQEIFAAAGEAGRFVRLVRAAKRRDDLLVYAWCVLSNHSHLVVRSWAVRLSRTMAFVQGGFRRSFNRRPSGSRGGVSGQGSWVGCWASIRTS